MICQRPRKTIIQVAAVVCAALAVSVLILYASNSLHDSSVKWTLQDKKYNANIPKVYSPKEVLPRNITHFIENKTLPHGLDSFSRAKKNNSRLFRKIFRNQSGSSTFYHSTGLENTTVKKTSFVTRRPTVVKSRYVALHKISTKREFWEKLHLVSGEGRTVIISVVDKGLKEMALNFYLTSIQKYQLVHFLYVCTDTEIQEYLSEKKISCFYYDLPSSVNILLNGLKQNTDFGSQNYYVRTNTKTLVVLDALQGNFTVLLVDVDMILFKDPFPYFTCTRCDIHISMDRQLRNSGFVLVRPSEASMELYQRAWDYFLQNHKSHDQAYLNMALNKMLVSGKLLIQELPTTQFPCGYYYFQADFRMFNNTPRCTECVVVHNNYIGSTAAKIYRFRENLLWAVDENGYYSSSDTQKFLTYFNPSISGGVSDEEVVDREMLALKNAMILGTALNRTVILPTFSCCDCKTRKCHRGKFKCSLLSVVRLKTFEEEYQGKYREHSFMWNPLVSNGIRLAEKTMIQVQAESNKTVFSSGASAVSLKTSDINSLSVIEKQKARQEFLQWLGAFKDSVVLQFSALLINFRFVQSDLESLYFDLHAQTSFQCSTYEQWEESLV